jgi:hypothetical protein
MAAPGGQEGRCHLHNIDNSISPDCPKCGVEEDVQHFLLDCHLFSPARAAMQREVDELLPDTAPNRLTLKLLLGADAPSRKRALVSDAVVRFVERTERRLRTWPAGTSDVSSTPPVSPAAPSSASVPLSGVAVSLQLDSEPPRSPRASDGASVDDADARSAPPSPSASAASAASMGD